MGGGIMPFIIGWAIGAAAGANGIVDIIPFVATVADVLPAWAALLERRGSEGGTCEGIPIMALAGIGRCVCWPLTPAWTI